MKIKNKIKVHYRELAFQRHRTTRQFLIIRFKSTLFSIFILYKHQTAVFANGNQADLYSIQIVSLEWERG